MRSQTSEKNRRFPRSPDCRPEFSTQIGEIQGGKGGRDYIIALGILCRSLKVLLCLLIHIAKLPFGFGVRTLEIVGKNL